jgi:hypothetical protein
MVTVYLLEDSQPLFTPEQAVWPPSLITGCYKRHVGSALSGCAMR